MICDLARADLPWIHYYDYIEKYKLNPVTEFLLDKPWEHRVIGKLEPRGPGSGIQQGFGMIYFFWLQNDFPYNNIETLDYSQFAHIPDLDRLYLKAFELNGSDPSVSDIRPAIRLWELTNTRFILASADGLGTLNRRANPIDQKFEARGSFNLVLKQGVTSLGDAGDFTAESSQKGQYTIIDFTRALPRAKLYSNWRTPAGDPETLALLASNDFDPWQTVLIATNTPVTPPESTSSADPGEVTITDHRPKYVRLQAEAKTAAVLLLNDRTGPDWQASIDGAPAPLLRCNYIMRGVYLTPGSHIVEFRFRTSLKSLYISLSAIVIGVILSGYLIITRRHGAPPAAQAAPSPTPPVPADPPKPRKAKKAK